MSNIYTWSELLEQAFYLRMINRLVRCRRRAVVPVFIEILFVFVRLVIISALQVYTQFWSKLYGLKILSKTQDSGQSLNNKVCFVDWTIYIVLILTYIYRPGMVILYIGRYRCETSLLHYSVDELWISQYIILIFYLFLVRICWGPCPPNQALCYEE